MNKVSITQRSGGRQVPTGAQLESAVIAGGGNVQHSGLTVDKKTRWVEYHGALTRQSFLAKLAELPDVTDPGRTWIIKYEP